MPGTHGRLRIRRAVADRSAVNGALGQARGYQEFPG
jgi:hypothetical protein